jgi:tRNA-splicing ligase RtcB
MISKSVPSGVGQGHDQGSNYKMVGKHFPDFPDTSEWGKDWERKALTQFGSLGSGNHFVEVCLDELDRVWVVLHSGSRGIGNVAANKHIDGAKGIMKEMFINLPDPDLAYLVEGTKEFDSYITDMLWAQDYAMGNREAMMHNVLRDVTNFLDTHIAVNDRINCHHNFTERENHRGQNLWITRKGAIRARTGDRGVIPGSMGTRSYIVSGNGAAASYCSCSHGAGRKMSRGDAKRTLDKATLVKQMEGIAWNGNVDALIDEDPRAYKDIDEVMENQKDLVTIEHTLHQILNYKGA